LARVVCALPDTTPNKIFFYLDTSRWLISDELPDTTLPIWPLPRHTLAVASEDVAMFISKDVKFKVNTASKVLQDAVERYKSFINTGDHNKCTHKAVKLSTINVLVSDDSEDLNGNRKYEVTINSNSKDVSVIASSPFGAM